jgi:uncharacterized protein
MIRIFLILSIQFLVLSGNSQSKQENIKELIAIMHMDSLAKKSLRQAITHQVNRLRFTDKDSLKVKEFLKSFKLAENDMADKLINNNLVTYFDKDFTDLEIKDLIKFFQTPVGQKTLVLFPKLELTIWNFLTDNYIPEIIDKVDKFAKEIHMTK